MVFFPLFARFYALIIYDDAVLKPVLNWIFFCFQEVSDLSNNLVEQSIEHEKRSKEFESNLRELEQQLRNARAELDRQATNLQDLLQERDNRLKVGAKRGKPQNVKRSLK